MLLIFSHYLFYAVGYTSIYKHAQHNTLLDDDVKVPKHVGMFVLYILRCVGVGFVNGDSSLIVRSGRAEVQ